MQKKNTWHLAHSILCIRLDSLGDVLMSTPALRALKQTRPNRRLTLLTSHSGSAVARFIPELHDVITYAAPWIKSCTPHDTSIDANIVRKLRAHRFDAAVILTSYSQSPLPAAMLCYLADIPLRVAHCHENPYQLLSDWIHDPEPHHMVRHEVRRQLDLVAEIGSHTDDEGLSFAVPENDIAWARRQLHAFGIHTAQPWLLLHPGASAPSRRYPPQLWIEMANLLGAALNCPLLFTGSIDEVPLVESIRAAIDPPSYSLAGQLDLGKFAALLSLASVLISNNTGPVHLSSAVGTPVVDLYALTNPQHTPWNVPNRVLYHDVPCGLCYKSICPQGHHHCLTKVAPARIVRETLELMRDVHISETPPANRCIEIR